MGAKRWRPSGDGGWTLTELLVVMVLLGLIGSIVTTSVAVAARTSEATSGQLYSTAAAQSAVDEIGEAVRAAQPEGNPPTAWVSAGPNSAEFYANLGDAAGPREVDVYFSGSALHEDWVQGATTVSHVITNSALQSSTTPLFAYYTQSGTELGSATTSVPASQTGSIAYVVLTFEMQDNSVMTHPMTDTTTVWLRNLEFH